MLPAERFASDGCTFFPDKWDVTDFLAACVEHDYAYWLGGTEEERLAADIRLRERIEALGYTFLAWVMFRVVRAAGGRYWPASPMPRRHHWGYGWPKDDYGAGYAAA